VEIDKELFLEYWEHTEGKRVEKIRYEMQYLGNTVEIDYFTDRDLILAEIEVASEEDANSLEPLGKDVTLDKKYKNANLAR